MLTIWHKIAQKLKATNWYIAARIIRYNYSWTVFHVVVNVYYKYDKLDVSVHGAFYFGTVAHSY